MICSICSVVIAVEVARRRAWRRSPSRSCRRSRSCVKLRLYGACRAGEPVVEVGPHPLGELTAGDLLAAVGEDVVAWLVAKCTSSWVSSSWFCSACTSEAGSMPSSQREVERQPQELGVAGHERVVVGGPGDEVVGQVGAGLAHRLDVVHRQVELLEGEPAHLADHARDQVVGRLRERMALRPRGQALGALLDPEEAVGVQAQRRREPRSASACSASPITSRIPANDGSSQLIEGWPSLK